MNRVVMKHATYLQRMWGKVFCFCVCVSGGIFQVQELTSADGAIAHVARLAGTQMSPDGVGADGVLITQILAAGALVML